MENILVIISIALVSAVIGAVVGYLVRKSIAEAKIPVRSMQPSKLSKTENEKLKLARKRLYSKRKMRIISCE
jgi:ribonuclease Y